MLVNPIGLEDWKAKGVPLATIDELYAAEQRTEAAKALGNYPVLAREAQARIKGSALVTFPDLGQSPQVQDPARPLLDHAPHPLQHQG